MVWRSWKPLSISYPIEPDWVARALIPVHAVDLAIQDTSLELCPAEYENDDRNCRYNERDHGSDDIGDEIVGTACGHCVL